MASSVKHSHPKTKNSESAPREMRAKIQSCVVHIAHGTTQVTQDHNSYLEQVNVYTKPNREDLKKESLETKSYPELKHMYTQLKSISLDGNTLLIAT
jgi:hypothetical protein